MRVSTLIDLIIINRWNDGRTDGRTKSPIETRVRDLKPHTNANDSAQSIYEGMNMTISRINKGHGKWKGCHRISPSMLSEYNDCWLRMWFAFRIGRLGKKSSVSGGTNVWNGNWSSSIIRCNARVFCLLCYTIPLLYTANTSISTSNNHENDS